jgi:hypothetical protein
VRRIHGQIQHIVHNLKGQSGLAAENGQPGYIIRCGSGVDAASHHAHPNQRAGLGAVNGVDQLRSGLEVFAFQVQHLAADHALDSADGVGNQADNLDDRFGGRGRRPKPGQHLEGAGLQRVAGQDGDGLAEDHVTGGLAAAQVVVVQSRQVVVDERVGVEHLEGRAQTGDSLGQRRRRW